jgi:ferredoxin
VDRVLGWLFARFEVAPEYLVERCLAAKATGCTACADICPHDAITINRRVTIDPVDCTGCGLCVQVCPSDALVPRGEVPGEAPLRCSQVEGEAASVVCLARLEATEILRLTSPTDDVLLAHGACATCTIGDATVPGRVAATAARAVELARLVGRELVVRVEEHERVDVPRAERVLSRRELFRSSGDRAKEVTSVALAPLERLAGEEEREARPLPQAWIDTLRLLERADLSPETLVPARLPRLEPGCILCPSCTRVCPTSAITRTFEEHGRVVLGLDPERCIGCDACVDVCPVRVVVMDDDITWARLSGGRVALAASGSPTPPQGSVTR